MDDHKFQIKIATQTRSYLSITTLAHQKFDGHTQQQAAEPLDTRNHYRSPNLRSQAHRSTGRWLIPQKRMVSAGDGKHQDALCLPPPQFLLFGSPHPSLSLKSLEAKEIHRREYQNCK